MHTQVDGRRWKELYRAAVLNSKSSDLSDRIAAAENAIISRTRELFGSNLGNIDERDELEQALYMLRAWKTSRLQQKKTA
jgi:hypothetical protein